MYPVIIDFGEFSFFGFEFHLAIYSFGFMLVVAFYSCYFLLHKDLKRLGYDQNLASDIVFLFLNILRAVSCAAILHHRFLFGLFRLLPRLFFHQRTT